MLMKTKTKNTVPAPAVTLEPTREEIAVRAYLVWEKNGRQPGREHENWLQAEAEIRAEYQRLNEAVRPEIVVSKPKAKARTPRATALTKSAKGKKRW
jgi:Protein of unknown function (DUF2934)